MYKNFYFVQKTQRHTNYAPQTMCGGSIAENCCFDTDLLYNTAVSYKLLFQFNSIQLSSSLKRARVHLKNFCYHSDGGDSQIFFVLLKNSLLIAWRNMR